MSDVAPFRIDPNPVSVVPNAVLGRPEGVALSRDAGLVAVAESDANRVSLFARRADGSYGATADFVIEGPETGLDYPHDVDFSPDDRLLAVANRDAPSITLYARRNGDPVRFETRPDSTIGGWRSRLRCTDGVRFVPPAGAFVAAINRKNDSVTFYRGTRGPAGNVRYARSPCFSLEGERTRIVRPDGLAFASDGALLAVANHGVHSVTIYARAARAPAYESTPLAEIRGDESHLRFPHSLAFAPDGAHLVVCNAGGRTVTVYRRAGPAADAAASWGSAPVFEIDTCDPARFERSNRASAQEGGPKGVAFGGACVAFCGSEFGLRVHRVLSGAAAPAAAERWYP